MSLHGDYSHYFCGSWIALVEGNVRVPLFVMDITDNSDMSSGDYSERHRAQLEFVCDRYDKDARGRIVRRREHFNVLNPNLILESPDVGYVKIDNNVRWTHIVPVRQRMKGLTGQKVRQLSVGQGTGELMYNLFNPEFPGLIDRYTYIAPHNNIIYYKGAVIGRVEPDNNRIVLLRIFKYLQTILLEPEFPVYTFDLVSNL